MSQLHASSAKKIALYFKNPSTLYEHFINKKWIERTNVFQSKQSFIKTAIESWNNSTDEESLKYLSQKAVPKNRRSITRFFAPKKKTSQTSEEVPNEKKSSSFSKSSCATTKTTNAFCANEQREKFLSDKELTMLITFLKEIGVDSGKFLINDDLVNNKSLMEIFKKICYSWKSFNDLKMSHKYAQQIEKSSSLKEKLETVSDNTKDVVEVFKEILDIRPMSGMDTFALSQTFIHKTKLVTTLFSHLSTLLTNISENILLQALRRRVKQQKWTTEKVFVRTNNELTNFACENDTRLSWKDVFEKLTNFENSREKFGLLSNSTMKEIAKIMESNIVTLISELKDYDLSELNVIEITQMFPVILVQSEKTSAFINLHEFSCTSGTLEYLLFPDKV